MRLVHIPQLTQRKTSTFSTLKPRRCWPGRGQLRTNGLQGIAQSRIWTPENKALAKFPKDLIKPLCACAVTPPQGEQINRAFLSLCTCGMIYRHIYEYRHKMSTVKSLKCLHAKEYVCNSQYKRLRVKRELTSSWRCTTRKFF